MRLLLAFLCSIALLPMSATGQTDEFDNLKSAFTQTVNSQFGSAAGNTWTTGAFFVRRDFAAHTINLLASKSSPRISGTLPPQLLSPQPADVSLQVKQIFNNCNFCGDCSWHNPVACACWAASFPVIEACEGTNALMRTFGGVEFGHISFHDVKAEANLDSSPMGLQFDATLSNAAFTGTVQGHGAIEGAADIHLTTLAGLFTACWPQQTAHIPSLPVHIRTTSLPLVTVVGEEKIANGIRFHLKASGGELKLSFDNNPFFETLKNNPQFLITCPISFSVLTVGSMADQIFSFDINFQFPAGAFDADIASFTLPLPQGSTAVVALQRTDFALGVVATSQAVSIGTKDKAQ